ncbi:GNAT family N-acetyltransferase [Anaerosporobacter faecicola]|uniref:GNAT family N-acetyltransferase n=1 Tax=Anaerosporobacter faecicola TaxID=2718714 RepID=UPI001438D998|nr:GNAT family N-acetyltransferase [Anaerosporobacter faecicola]
MQRTAENAESEKIMLSQVDMTYEELQTYIRETSSFGIEELEGKEREDREACVKQAMEDIDVLLPEGIHTKNNTIRKYVDEKGNEVGALWTTVRTEEEYLLLALINVKADQRGKGYGTELMELVKQEARDKNIGLVALGVYKMNTVAIKLYEKCGFHIFDEEEFRYAMVWQNKNESRDE